MPRGALASNGLSKSKGNLNQRLRGEACSFKGLGAKIMPSRTGDGRAASLRASPPEARHRMPTPARYRR